MLSVWDFPWSKLRVAQVIESLKAAHAQYCVGVGQKRWCFKLAEIIKQCGRLTEKEAHEGLEIIELILESDENAKPKELR